MCIAVLTIRSAKSGQFGHAVDWTTRLERPASLSAAMLHRTIAQMLLPAIAMGRKSVELVGQVNLDVPDQRMALDSHRRVGRG